MGRAIRGAAIGIAALALGACAGARIENGVYHAESGYRVAVPASGWEVVDDSRADLELRHQRDAAGMLVNGLCDADVLRRRRDILARHLLIGLRDRAEIERDEVRVNGRLASHRLVEGRMRQNDARVRVESYTLKGDRCVYDLLFVAEPAAFAAHRGDFQRLVDSFTEP